MCVLLSSCFCTGAEETHVEPLRVTGSLPDNHQSRSAHSGSEQFLAKVPVCDPVVPPFKALNI